MARLYLFVEGKTEQTFSTDVLFPHLWQFELHGAKCIEIAKAKRGPRVERGGGIKYAPMAADIRRIMSQEKGQDVYFSTMIDLYGLPRNFPGLGESKKLRDAYQRVSFLEEQFRQDIGDHRFIPYIQLHEFEAYLFADITQLAPSFGDVDKCIDRLCKVAAGFESPEHINDGTETAPSKRIIAEIKAYDDRKASVGPLAAERIGLQTIRSKCTHFDSWVKRLEELGTSTQGA